MAGGSWRRPSISSLDGPWRFWPDIDGALPTGPGAPFVPTAERDVQLGPARMARVPAPWQAVFDDLRLWAGTAWYERSFIAPETGLGERVRITFGAVDYFSAVWINGRPAGEHEGGYLPFSLDVTELLRTGAPNTVTVRALDVGPGDERPPFPFSEIPHGKQSWYGPIGGPWQPISLEARGATFLDHVRIVADPVSGEISTVVRLDRIRPGGVEVRWRVLDPGGTVVRDGALVAENQAEVLLGARIPDVAPWSPDSPSLYTFQSEVARDGVVIDRRSDRFGFRTVAIADGRVLVNGEPVYLLGALDQDYWMPGIATPEGPADFDREMGRANELGLNLLRCHIKPPDPRYLDAADRAGILVWCEPPSWIRLTPDAERRVRDTFEGMVRRDANHPSLVIRSIVNEDWGTDLVGEADDRVWLREMVAWARSLDPTRLVVDNSACPPNFHLASDLNDYHLYRAVPEQTGSWRAWTRDWVSDPATTYSPHGDGDRHGSEPLVLSEFGIWGLPDPRALSDEAGREPWWFVMGRDHSDGVGRPAGVLERFEAWGLGEVFGGFERFVEESQQHQFNGLARQIADLRWHDAVAGYVITELTDVHWEANGLLDMRRDPKSSHRRYRSINSPNLVLVRPERSRYRAGERVVAKVLAVGPRGRTDGRIAWRVPALGLGGQTGSGGRIGFDVPIVDQARRVDLEVRWIDEDGPLVHRTEAPLWLFPARDPRPREDVLVTARWDAAERALGAGGRVVLVPSDEGEVPSGSRLRLEPFAREEAGGSGSIYADGWVLSSGMGWISPALSAGLPIGPTVDLAFEGLTPTSLIEGYGAVDRSDVLAGHYLGWVHRVRAIVGAFSYASGAGILCTLPLLEADDPLAGALLERITAIAGAAEFAPRTRLGSEHR